MRAVHPVNTRMRKKSVLPEIGQTKTPRAANDGFNVQVHREEVHMDFSADAPAAVLGRGRQ